MIERRERRRRDGTVYAVWRARWRDETGAERSKTFDRAADARAWEAKVRMMKRGGAARAARSSTGVILLAEHARIHRSVGEKFAPTVRGGPCRA